VAVPHQQFSSAATAQQIKQGNEDETIATVQKGEERA